LAILHLQDAVKDVQRAGDGHALLLAAGEGVGRLSARWPRLSRRPRRVAV